MTGRATSRDIKELKKALKKCLQGINTSLNKDNVITDDIHFDLLPTGGVDTLGSKTGTTYTISDLKTIITNLGATYSVDGSTFDAGDAITKIYIGLKAAGNPAFHEGDPANEGSSSTSMAAYKNNGGWSFLSSGGQRTDTQFTELNPTSVEEIFIENGTAVIVRIEFQKVS